MKNKAITLLPICFLFLSASIVPPSKNFKYKSEEGKMSVTFPAAYESTTDEKENIKIVKITTEVNEQTFFASYTVHQQQMEDRESLAELSLDSFTETTEGTITQKSAWKIKKNKGYKAMIDLNKQNAQIQYQAIIIGQLQYQLVVVAPKNKWDQKAADRFLKSFKVRK